MIEITNAAVYNLAGAMRGMRNPLESWAKNDSNDTEIGPNDLELALKLVRAGTDHSKFMRQIFVSLDITAPMSWWWDMDTYKVGTTKNSTSRMHKLGTRELTADDFSFDDNNGVVDASGLRSLMLLAVNNRIRAWQQSKDPDLWRSIHLDLPQSYNFTATWTANYQVLRSVWHSRRNHKQREFREFCRWICQNLPHSELFTEQAGPGCMSGPCPEGAMSCGKAHTK